MACSPCTSSPIIFGTQYFYNQQCADCTSLPCGCATQDAKCVVYNGPALTCSGGDPGDTLETILQKLDEQVCSVIGDYSDYEFNCLEDWCLCTITTEAQFVDQITAYACETRTNLNVFISSTFPTYQSALDSRFTGLEDPQITCVAAGVTNVDSLNTILTKYCTLLTSIKAAINVSSVDWDQCFVVGSPPSTVIGGFDLLIDQICTVKATADAAAVLPTFNNTGNCLDGTSTDTLVQTIGAITTLLCTVPSFDIGDVEWGCVGEPETFTGGIQNIVTEVNALMEIAPTFSEDFVVEATDPEDPCAGVTISLSTPLNLDRFVASNDDDETPGTLEDKLIEGDGITLDFDTTPGGVIITSTGDTYKVLANVADDTPGYLDAKVEGDTDGVITITTAYDSGPKKVQITPSIDVDALMELFFSTIEGNVEWGARFCALATACVPGFECTGYTLTNTEGIDGARGYYTYTDCDGTPQNGFLDPGDDVDICAIGSVGIIGTISQVSGGSCSGGTTTTTTATP